VAAPAAVKTLPTGRLPSLGAGLFVVTHWLPGEESNVKVSGLTPRFVASSIHLCASRISEAVLMDNLIVKRMLNQVSAIARTQRKITLLSGENFNVFRILKMESKEVGTHSAFLGELLNPAGSHGMKDTFLKLFIEQIGFPEFDTEGAKLVVEKYIGQIDTDYLQGGRIDIYLESKGEYLFIENKIYAIDQPNQLLRYHKHKPNAKLLYLTLKGDEYAGASDDMQSGKHYHRLSYRDDITSWLDRCHQAAAAHPIVRETILQYIHLVNHLTGRTPNNFMKEETKQLILGDYASYESAWYCKQMVEELEREIPWIFWAELENIWQNRLPGLVSTLNGYQVMVAYDSYESDLWYSFDIKPLLSDQQVPAAVENAFTAAAAAVGGQLHIEYPNEVRGEFLNVKHPNSWNREMKFAMGDENERRMMINEMIDQVESDAKALATRLEILNQAEISAE